MLQISLVFQQEIPWVIQKREAFMLIVSKFQSFCHRNRGPFIISPLKEEEQLYSATTTAVSILHTGNCVTVNGVQLKMLRIAQNSSYVHYTCTTQAYFKCMSGFFHWYCGFKYNRISELLSLGEKSNHQGFFYHLIKFLLKFCV